jgi:hypothetical protein
VQSNLGQKAMLSLLVSIIASCATVVGFSFIVGRAVPCLPNKVCRFFFLFVLGVPMIFVTNYLHVRTLGYHKVGWTLALTIALLGATWGNSLDTATAQLEDSLTCR